MDIVIVNDMADEKNMEKFFAVLEQITVRSNVDINPNQTTIIIVDDDRKYTVFPTDHITKNCKVRSCFGASFPYFLYLHSQ